MYLPPVPPSLTSLPYSSLPYSSIIKIPYIPPLHPSRTSPRASLPYIPPVPPSRTFLPYIPPTSLGSQVVLVGYTSKCRHNCVLSGIIFFTYFFYVISVFCIHVMCFLSFVDFNKIFYPGTFPFYPF